jgi:arylsulfatase
VDKLSRREFGSLLPAASVAAPAANASQNAPAAEESPRSVPRRPNIVLLTTDHMRIDEIGANGSPHMATPVFDSLVRRGVTFTMCHTVGIACAPNRASLFTGRYPHSHGLMSNGIKMPEEEVTITRVLRNAGYYTGQFGKLHFWPHAARNHREFHPWWDFHQVLLSDEPGCYDDAYGLWLNAQGPEVRRKANVRMPPAALKFTLRRPLAHTPPPPVHGLEMYTFEGDERTTHAHWVASETIGFIDECHRTRPQQPFFVHAGFYAPHPPLNPPASQLARYKGRRFPPRKLDAGEADYVPPSIARQMRAMAAIPESVWTDYRRHAYAMVSNVDRNVGRIFEAVERAGQLDNTIFVLTADHGDFLGDHNLNGKNANPYEGDRVIPLVFAGPGAPAGRRVDGLCEIVDVMPTLLDLLGISQTQGNQGISLVPAMRGGKARDIIFMEGFTNQIIQTREALYCCWKDGQEMLFDLQQDPNQFRNLSQVARAKPLLEEMRAQLLRLNMELVDPLPPRVAAY